jgi:hypothetical protein
MIYPRFLAYDLVKKMTTREEFCKLLQFLTLNVRVITCHSLCITA